ncbi:putative dsRNA-binding protein [Deinococcus lacus]|uniref:DsRNA-binding protein n=1 Tax=Deinococcus lacus TaxID=392561 RepID=A0ABW1YHY6_9DEIO
MENSNAKGDLIALLLSQGRPAPVFQVEAGGPPHERTFAASALVGGQALGTGQGRTKREAERLAAEAALGALNGPPQPASPVAAERGGPWPIYAAVLAEALAVTSSHLPPGTGLDTLRAEAAQLYCDLLSDLGHGPEEA